MTKTPNVFEFQAYSDDEGGTHVYIGLPNKEGKALERMYVTLEEATALARELMDFLARAQAN